MEQKELIQQLREEFLELYTYKEELLSNKKTSVYVRYINLIGREEFELFNLEIELKALKMKVKMAQAYRNRQESPNIMAIERRIAQLWKEHEERLNTMMAGLEYADSTRTISATFFEDARNIYRMLVKRLHPDLHPELSDELHDMLIAAQAAYKMHDVNTLRQLVIKYELLTDSKKEEVDMPNPEDYINMLEKQIKELKQSIEDMENSFPLNYAEKLSDEEWVKEQQDIMKQKREAMESEMAKQNEIYSLLTEY